MADYSLGVDTDLSSGLSGSEGSMPASSGNSLGSILSGSGLGVGMNLMGGFIQNNAAQNVANAQNQQAQWLQGKGQELAAPTASELALQGQQLNLANTNLQQQLQLLSAINPTILQAGKNLLALQQGGNAPQTEAAKAELDQQKKDLTSQLQQQFGSGAMANSSVQNLLTRFGQQSATTLGNLNQQAMQGYQGYLGQGLGVAQQGLGQTGQQLNSAMSSQQTQQNMQLGALLGTSKATMDTAGSQYAGSAGLGGILGAAGGSPSGGSSGGGGNGGMLGSIGNAVGSAAGSAVGLIGSIL